MIYNARFTNHATRKEEIKQVNAISLSDAYGKAQKMLSHRMVLVDVTIAKGQNK